MQRRVIQDSKRNPVTTRTYATYGEYSVRTGRPVAVLGHLQGQGQTGGTSTGPARLAPR